MFCTVSVSMFFSLFASLGWFVISLVSQTCSSSTGPARLGFVKSVFTIKVTVQFERCFRLMEHIPVISCYNPINLYITEKLIKFSKSLFSFIW